MPVSKDQAIKEQRDKCWESVSKLAEEIDDKIHTDYQPGKTLTVELSKTVDWPESYFLIDMYEEQGWEIQIDNQQHFMNTVVKLS